METDLALRAVLFDLDDTLTDRTATVHAYSHRFVADFGAHFRLTDPATVAAELLRIDRNGYNRARASDLAAHGAWIASPGAEILAEHWNHHIVVCTQGRKGLLSTFDALKQAGLRLGVVTNGPTQKQRRKIEALELQARLGALLISEEFGAAKPNPKIFLAAAAALEVQPSECMFIGDNPAKDVGGASAVGMRAVWFRGTIQWPSELASPQESIGSLQQVLELATETT
jgi:putative hydrolase of the HAD superfamily